MLTWSCSMGGMVISARSFSNLSWRGKFKPGFKYLRWPESMPLKTPWAGVWIPSSPCCTLHFDLSLEGGEQKMNLSLLGSIADHKKVLLAEYCMWQRQNSPLELWPCAQAALTGFQIWAVFGKEQGLLIDGGPTHLLLPIISALGQRSPLKCYHSPSLLYIISPSLCLFVLSISLLNLCLRQRELCITLIHSPSIYLSPFIFLHLCGPCTPLPLSFFCCLSLGSCGVS